MRIHDLSSHHARRVELVLHGLWINRLLRHSEAPDRSEDDSPLRTRVAVDVEERAVAEELVRRRYAWRGYRTASAAERDCAGPRPGEHWVTLLAEAAGKLLGTLTVGPDWPGGLLAERTYGKEIESLRRNGSRLGEVTKLAIEEGVEYKPALDALVRGAWTVTRVVHSLTDVVIEVNPRHVKFYERIFGFVVVAAGRLCARVGAPSVLLILDLEQFGRRMGLADPLA
jgi:hypothetical protein